MLSQQVGWFDGKGCLHPFQRSKDQTSWVVLCVVNNGKLIEYSPIEFLKYVPRLIMWPTYLVRFLT
jgi:hypothetical protein